MALVLKDRVLESSTSTGTGTFTLTGAQTGYQGFDVIGNGNTTYYTIQGKDANGNLTGEWEVGVGTWSTGNTLARDTVLESSNANAKVVFSTGAKDVFCDLPAEKVLTPTGTSSQLLANDGSGGLSNVTIGTNLTYAGGTLSASGGSPAGSTGQVQYNTAGAFGASANLQFTGSNLLIGQTYDQGTGALQVTGTNTVNGNAVDKNLYLQGGNNLFNYSQDFTNAVWSKTNTSVTANSTSAPDSTTTATTITRTITTTSEAILRFNTSQANGTIYTVSVFAKVGTAGNSLYMRNLAVDGSTSTGLVKFNLTSATIDLTSGSTYAGKAFINAVGNGWYRCSITGTTLLSIVNNLVDIGQTSSSLVGGTGGDFLYAWGAQLELGSVASSYTPTTTAAITTTNNIYVPSGSVFAPSVTATTTDLTLSAISTGAVKFSTLGGLQAQVSNIASAVNYHSFSGSATTKAVQFQTLGSDANISLAFQPKGTGAIDLAAGSSGVNISNGGTVTSLTRTNTGTGYTTSPTWSASAPTTAGGVTATGTTTLALQGAPTVTNGGTGYTVGDTLTLVGGTGTATTLTVSTVSSGVITGVTILSNGAYTVVPTSPISVTGGTGTSATFTSTLWGITATIAIGNAGSGYIEQPTITFSGGGGSAAAAYATVGSGTIVRSLAAATSFYTAAGESFRVAQSATFGTGYWTANGSGTTPSLFASGANGIIGTTGAGVLQFTPNNVEQFRVSNTASAVDYVQITGSTTANKAVTISAQGSDADIDLTLTPKGTGRVRFGTYTASVLTPTGYIEVKDSGGTLRRLLVG
jgi:hypothetical protein